MIIYISGRIYGADRVSRVHFLAAQRALEQNGQTVLTPAMLPSNLPSESYMPICLAMINEADAVFMLNNWEESEGARLERMFAIRQRKRILYENSDADCEELNIEADLPEMHSCIECSHFIGSILNGYCDIDEHGNKKGIKPTCENFSKRE